jgi:transcriptional regulator with XRE-family HTH domain
MDWGRRVPPQRRVSPRSDELAALGRAICALRERAGLTQEQLADASGLHATWLGEAERGRRNPTYQSLSRLAAGLGVPLAELVRLAGEARST